MPESLEISVPFRWDLIAPDRLGSMLAGIAAPDLWFVDELVRCAGKVVARSGDGDLYFVGRSLDSMFDLLGAAMSGVDGAPPLCRVPFSFRCCAMLTGRRWRTPALSAGQRAAARRPLADVGITPRALARRKRPVTFVDVVSAGSTFTELFDLLYGWVGDAREPWQVIRRKIRFVGVTWRHRTSPNTWRWQQHTAWVRLLPAGGVTNVSLDGAVWSYLGNSQVKLTESFHPGRWL